MYGTLYMLTGKTAIVSGVGTGLGDAIATVLAKNGASVLLVARDADHLKQTAAGIQDAGGKALALPTDITDPDQCLAAVATATREFGSVDILVNNAVRYAPYDLIAESKLDDWRAVFEVNMFGTMAMCQAAVPALRERGGGSIVFINSQVVRNYYRQQRPQGPYAASKGALLATAMHMAGELGSEGIRVNSVVPGWIWGPRVKARFQREAAERGVDLQVVYDEIAVRTALHMLPLPEDVANAVLFFASDLSRAVTGQSLDVNGGESFH
jgi:NAD(P)-dependent dehydrogenase (short-subunit alcohol dehydrogenase family)